MIVELNEKSLDILLFIENIKYSIRKSQIDVYTTNENLHQIGNAIMNITDNQNILESKLKILVINICEQLFE